ncbi:UDP-N-acetylglucosamine transferase subunit ALG13 homolog isoform X2 [Nilaparvata lugens]|uniref:UDP-N-acetylglucosamine transferase subunit ALG13 homolog isoform X2 n=1 Tax=Nilaparvata lugens TaxID=108931 RepID=UPI000B985912|nr:UDP-N-acetylglucosamine transferase subunit ALG13 homolog isoform X2 [Nilaparvata lugens]
MKSRMALEAKNCKSLIIQVGKGVIPAVEYQSKMKIEFYRFKDSIEDDIKKSDLTISHAGAGSCLNVLQAGKRLLVVVNERLMDNHQIELAERLALEKYSFFTTLSLLTDFLEGDVNFDEIEPYPLGQTGKFVEFIDSVMGFVDS